MWRVCRDTQTDRQRERERERETAESFQRDPALSCNSSDNDVHLCRTARPTCSRLIDIIRITTMFEIEILRQDKTYSWKKISSEIVTIWWSKTFHILTVWCSAWRLRLVCLLSHQLRSLLAPYAGELLWRGITRSKHRFMHSLPADLTTVTHCCLGYWPCSNSSVSIRFRMPPLFGNRGFAIISRASYYCHCLQMIDNSSSL